MNRIILLVCVIVLGSTIIGCKSDGTSGQSKKAKEYKEPSPAMTALRDRAKSVYDFRMKNTEFSTAQILDNGVWEYKFTFAEGAMSKLGELTGKWIDFEDNNTYEYGLYGDVKGSGIYHYDPLTTIALLIDDDPSVKPQEFEMKIVMDALVMVGQKTYNDNGTQSKLDKRDVRPTKG